MEDCLATCAYDDGKGIRRQVTEVVVGDPQGGVNVLAPKAEDGPARGR